MFKVLAPSYGVTLEGAEDKTVATQVYNSLSAYVAMLTESDGVKIDVYLYVSKFYVDSKNVCK